MRSATMAKKVYPYQFGLIQHGEEEHRNWLVRTMGQAYENYILGALRNPFFDCKSALVHKQIAMYCLWDMVDRSPYRCLWELRHWMNTALAAGVTGVAFDRAVAQGGAGSYHRVDPDTMIQLVMFQIDSHRGINAQHDGARHCSAWDNRVTLSDKFINTFIDRLSLVCHWRADPSHSHAIANRRTTRTTAAWMAEVIECIPLYLTGLRTLDKISGHDWATHTRNELLRYAGYRSSKMLKHIAEQYEDEDDRFMTTHEYADMLDDEAVDRYSSLGKIRQDVGYEGSYQLDYRWSALPL